MSDFDVDINLFRRQLANVVNHMISSVPDVAVAVTGPRPNIRPDSNNKAVPSQHPVKPPAKSTNKPKAQTNNRQPVVLGGDADKYIKNVSVIGNVNDNVRQYLKIIAYLLKTKFDGKTVYLTSGYRPPEKQVDVMIQNWRDNGGNNPLPKPVSIKGVTVNTKGELDTVKIYGATVGKAFHMSLTTKSPNDARDEWIKYYQNQEKEYNEKGKASHVNGAAIDFRSTGYPFVKQLIEMSKTYADINFGDETNRASPHYHVAVLGIKSMPTETIQNTTMLFPLNYKTAFQISVEPYNTVINEELANMAAKLGQQYFSYLDKKTGKTIQVEKIVLEDGDPGHFGMVRSDNPSTIYLSLNKIKSATVGASDQEATRAAIREVLSHEMGHLKDNMAGGEGPADAEANRVKGVFGSYNSFATQISAELYSVGLKMESALVQSTIGNKQAVLPDKFNPEDISESLLRIIYHFVQKVKPENQNKYVHSIGRKLQQIDMAGVAGNRKNPGGGVGQTMALVKNILSGLEPGVIVQTLNLTLTGMGKLLK